MRREEWWLALWTGLIVLVVVPWAAFQNHPHWQRVGWIPFMSPEVRVSDIVSNVALYVPFGYFFVRRSATAPRGAWTALAFAAVLSVITEATQSYSHGRFPSMTDVTCNVLGTWAGAMWCRARIDRNVKRVSNDDRSGTM